MARTLNRRRSAFSKFTETHPVLSMLAVLFFFTAFIGTVNQLPSPAPVTIYRSWATKEVKWVVDNKTGQKIPYDPQKHRVVKDNVWIR